jgi:5'-nucleotidase
VAAKHGASVLRRLVDVPWSEGVLMNVNFPYLAKGDVSGVQVVRQGRRISNIEVTPVTDAVGRRYLWIGDFTNDNPQRHGTDLSAVQEKAIAITPLHLDLTHRGMMRRLSESFG